MGRDQQNDEQEGDDYDLPDYGKDECCKAKGQEVFFETVCIAGQDDRIKMSEALKRIKCNRSSANRLERYSFETAGACRRLPEHQGEGTSNGNLGSSIIS